MKIRALLIGDIRFQFKYGFYLLYLLFTVIYVSLLYLLPGAWKKPAAVLMIFSDPAAMGLYFMGAIVLFEKSERVLSSLAVSPIKPTEYVAAKLLSIALIAVLVALGIGLGGGVLSAPFSFVTGVFLGSCLFSSVGVILAANIASLNQFIVATIPAELVMNLPALAYLFGWRPAWLLVHPSVCMIELLENGTLSLPAAGILTVWTLLAVWFAVRVMEKSLRHLGGVRL